MQRMLIERNFVLKLTLQAAELDPELFLDKSISVVRDDPFRSGWKQARICA